MAHQNNYEIQFRQAIQTFLSMNMEEIILKNRLNADETYLYLTYFGVPYRIDRTTGDFSRLLNRRWEGAMRHGIVMTILDLLNHPMHTPAGIQKHMASFGLQFHSPLLETAKDTFAARIAQSPDGFRRGCEALGGVPDTIGDISYRLPVFDDLTMTIAFWFPDDEFPAATRYYWDANAIQYLHYETMYYALDSLREDLTAFC